jgi:chaperonin GroES
MSKKGLFRMTPLHDRVVIKADKVETTTKGGIIIPDNAKEKPQHGTVIAAGPGILDYPTTVKVDDKVLYAKHAGTEITLDGDEYLIMRESDILAIL